MSTDPEVAAAKARADASRQRLMATVAETKVRLSPSTIASKTADGLRARANDGVVAAKRNPRPVAIAGGVLALLVLRKPIFGLFKRRKKKKAKAADIPVVLPNPAAAQPAPAPEVDAASTPQERTSS